MAEVDNTHTAPVWLKVGDMTCAGCASAVERALRSVPGVERAEVDLASASARIEGPVTAEQLTAAVQRSGFEAHAIEAPGDASDGRARR